MLDNLVLSIEESSFFKILSICDLVLMWLQTKFALLTSLTALICNNVLLYIVVKNCVKLPLNKSIVVGKSFKILSTLLLFKKVYM